MADIVDEVLIEESDQKKFNYFQRYLPYVILFTIIGVIIISSYSYLQSRKVEKNQKISDNFLEIISDESLNNEEMIQKLSTLKSEYNNNLLGLIDLYIANIVADNSLQEKLNQLSNIYNNDSYNELTKSFAKILWINHVIYDEKLILEKQDEIEKNFKSFENDQSLFHYQAKLSEAIYFMKLKNNEQSIKICEYLINHNKASSINKEQARALLAILTK